MSSGCSATFQAARSTRPCSHFFLIVHFKEFGGTVSASNTHISTAVCFLLPVLFWSENANLSDFKPNQEPPRRTINSTQGLVTIDQSGLSWTQSIFPTLLLLKSLLSSRLVAMVTDLRGGGGNKRTQSTHSGGENQNDTAWSSFQNSFEGLRFRLWGY